MQEAHPPKLRARRAQEQPVHLRGTDSQQRRDITQSRWHPVPYMFGGFLPRHPNTLPTLQGLEGCPLSTAHLLGPSHPCLLGAVPSPSPPGLPAKCPQAMRKPVYSTQPGEPVWLLLICVWNSLPQLRVQWNSICRPLYPVSFRGP